MEKAAGRRRRCDQGLRTPVLALPPIPLGFHIPAIANSSTIPPRPVAHPKNAAP
ncbi:hypothetical protein C8R44DRAFT_821675 [Mycena epipterygia]|nr:hypothetical protein C8R44DRAFT_821675 [Mycena epipterygia]